MRHFRARAAQQRCSLSRARGFGVLRDTGSAVFGCCGSGSASSGALGTAISTGLLFSAGAFVPARAGALFSGAGNAAAWFSLASVDGFGVLRDTGSTVLGCCDNGSASSGTLTTATSAGLLFCAGALVPARVGGPFSGTGGAAALVSLASGGLGVLRETASTVFGCCGNGLASSGALSTAIAGLLFCAGPLVPARVGASFSGAGGAAAWFSLASAGGLVVFRATGSAVFGCCGNGSANSGTMTTANIFGLTILRRALSAGERGCAIFGGGRCGGVVLTHERRLRGVSQHGIDCFWLLRQ